MPEERGSLLYIEKNHMVKQQLIKQYLNLSFILMRENHHPPEGQEIKKKDMYKTSALFLAFTGKTHPEGNDTISLLY